MHPTKSETLQEQSIGNLVVKNVPHIPPALIEQLRQYQNTRSAILADWDSEEKGIYIITRFANNNQVHHVRAATAARHQITFFDEPIASLQTCPNPDFDGFLFTKDTGGNEVYQIYLHHRPSNTTTLLSDGVSRHNNAKWNESGTKILFKSNGNTQTDSYFYCIDRNEAQHQKAQLLLHLTTDSWMVLDWYENILLLYQYHSASESCLYQYDTNTQKLQQLNAEAETCSYVAKAQIAPDKKTIYWISDQHTEHHALYQYHIDTQQLQLLTPDLDWDVVNFIVAHDWQYMLFMINENGYDRLYKLSLKTFRSVPIVVPEGIFNIRLNKQHQLALGWSSATQTSDVWVLNLQNKQLKRWTHSETGGLKTENFVRPTAFYYPTFDHESSGKVRQIPAYIYLPHHKKSDIPVLIYIHGGPESQIRPNFMPWFQFLVNELGIALVMPNVRGSKGYGKTYLSLDNGYLREDSVHDIGALLDWIETQEHLDKQRIAVMGGSYGGYMTLAALMHYNDRLCCGIDSVGITNFVTFLTNTAAYRRDVRRAEYGDERDPQMYQFLQNISPLNNTHRITKPLLVYQGQNDPRVPLSEANQMVAALQQQGNEVWYIVARNEGHTIMSKQNQNYVEAARTLFLKRFLLG